MKKKLFFIILIIINLYNCKMNNDMIILPIDKEFNEQLLTGKGLDSNLFSRKEVVQYYTIKGYDDTLTNEFKSKIEQFILEKYNYNEVIKKKYFTILFYKEDFFADYKQNLYESARDNQNGLIESNKQNLIVNITLQAKNETDKNVSVNITLYKESEVEAEYSTKLKLK